MQYSEILLEESTVSPDTDLAILILTNPFLKHKGKISSVTFPGMNIHPLRGKFYVNTYCTSSKF